MIRIFPIAVTLSSHPPLHLLAQDLMEIYFIGGFAFLLDESLKAPPVEHLELALLRVRRGRWSPSIERGASNTAEPLGGRGASNIRPHLEGTKLAYFLYAGCEQ